VNRRVLRIGGVVLIVAGIMVVAQQQAPLGIVLQGIIRGTGTGLLGVGLVLIYRSARIVNFAYGATGGFAAAVGISMFSGWGVPWFVAVAAACVVGILVGVIVERFVIRRFAGSSRLVLTVATIGLAQVLGGMQVLVPPMFGASALVTTFTTPLSSTQITTFFPVVIDGNDLLLLAFVPVVLGLLSWFLLRTDSGVAVRGIAENAERARLIGIPVDSLSTLVWGIACLLAAGATMLTAPNQGLALNVASGPTLLLPALAAAVIAGMEDLETAFIAGIGLGLLDKLVIWNVGSGGVDELLKSWGIDANGLTSVLYLVVILVALTLRKGAQGRAQTAELWSGGIRQRLPKDVARLPQIRQTGIIFGVVVGVVALGAPLVLRSSQLSVVTTALIAGIMVTSVVMLTGWGGSVSLGQYAIAGIGGLITANMVSRSGADLFVTLAISAAAGALVALVLGAPSLRLNGLFLAVTTMAFAVAVDSFLINPVNFPQIMPSQFTRPWLWSRFDLSDNEVMYYFCLALLAAAIVLVTGVRHGRPGRILLGTRDNERAAAAAGIPTTRTRLSAFVFSGMLAGVAGGLVVVQIGGLAPHTFTPDMSMLLFSMAVIGGVESLGGGLLGVALISLLSYLFPDYQLIITGSGLLVVLLIVPRGLTELVDRVHLRLQMALARSRRSTAAVEVLQSGFLVAPGDFQRSSPAMAGVPPARRAPGAVPVGGSVLHCDAVEASYGPMQVLFGVDLQVMPGEIVALLGTNGAGKSTLLRCITGLMATSGGAVHLHDDDVARLSPEQVARRGVALMPGGRGIFPQLTVDENLRLGAWLVRRDAGKATAARDWAVATFPVLGERLHLAAGDLSGGEQQMLSLSMAMAAKPEVLCIDELSLGLAPTVVSTLVERVREVHAAGTTVLVVEQSVNVALQLAERAVFLEKGRIHYEGSTAELRARPDLLRAVFMGDTSGLVSGSASGGAADNPMRVPTALASASSRTVRGARLETRGLTKRYGGITAVDHVDLVVEPRSIIGIIGHNGAGKTTLFDILSGFTKPDSGRILLDGRDLTDTPPHKRAIAGLGRSFQEARLYPSLSVADTVMLALDTSLAVRTAAAAAFRLPNALDSEAAGRRRVDEVLDLLGLRNYHESLVAELSTGTRRIVELACLLALEPEVLMLDEPSGGVAQKEAEALGPLLRRIQEHTGTSMIIIEHDVALMTGLCDEFVAMELGHVITRGLPADVMTHPEVVASYLGTDGTAVNRSGPTPTSARPPERVRVSTGGGRGPDDEPPRRTPPAPPAPPSPAATRPPAPSGRPAPPSPPRPPAAPPSAAPPRPAPLQHRVPAKPMPARPRPRTPGAPPPPPPGPASDKRQPAPTPTPTAEHPVIGRYGRDRGQFQ
jgi:ABC-type branched-subunit amino acid transport system ATPase component/ABC-type branched-subunit amino acid transport system permease subunit